MDELSTLWIVGVVALLIGAVVGLLIARSSSGGKSREALIEELNDTRREMEQYKQEVSIHFAQTADLVNKLTDSYRDVHQHLSKSAQKLCDDETLVASLVAQGQRPVLGAPAEEPAAAEPSVEAPKDYAPKNPNEAGTLSEQYGLKSRPPEEEEPFDPTRLADTGPDEAEQESKARH